MPEVRDTFKALPPSDFEPLWWELDPAYQIGRLYIIEYVIEGENGGTWHVEIVGDSDSPPPRNCKVLEGPAEPPDLRLTLAADDWLSIVNGQASPYALLASGRLRANGDRRLIGDLEFLGLLRRPPDNDEVEVHKKKGWAEIPSWVLPRVVSAGKIDYDKWRYFADERHELKARLAWEPWSPWLVIALASVFLILVANVVTVNWLRWPAFLAIAVGVLLAKPLVLSFLRMAEIHKLSPRMITELALKDEAFFRFGIEHDLIKIVPYWH